MKPQGIVIVVIILIIVGLASIHDKKKADKIRAEVDKKFEGRHVCDFKNIYYSGYIADNTLVIKVYAKGYLQIDLEKVKVIEKRTTRMNGVPMTYLIFGDENGKAVENGKKLKAMSPKAADELLDLIIKNTEWIRLS